MSTPPAFEEASACNGCKKAFGLLKRRHHCRNCGKSFCGDCQTKTMPLPAYGLSDPQRVCEPCAAQLTATPKKAPVSPPASNSKPAAATGGGVPAGMSTPAMRAGGGAAAATAPAPVDKKEAPTAAAAAGAAAPAPVKARRVKQCKCGFPMCICPEDPIEKDDKQNAPTPAPAKPAPKPTASAPSGAASTTFLAPKQSGFSGFGQRSAGEYDMHGDLNEQCREAIKANDLAGVTKLLKAGASATYRDRTGATLLHLAAMFDRQAMVSMLVKAGADVNAKNAHGETPIDLAPPSLAAKIAARKFDA